MATSLEAVGFDVRLVTDADIAAMRTEIEGFGKRLRRAGGDAVGLFYYAGHGVESRGTNYLIPVGAEIESAVEFEIDAVPARWVLSFMEAAGNRLNLVILDACRNNPFGTGRGAPQGLASMDAPSGSLIAYSAAPGQTATDGTGDNSPYTAALAARLAEPGLKVEDVFKRVRVAVEEATRGEQTPWENSSLRGDFYFTAPAVPEAPATTVAAVTPPPPSPPPQDRGAAGVRGGRAGGHGGRIPAGGRAVPGNVLCRAGRGAGREAGAGRSAGPGRALRGSGGAVAGTGAARASADPEGVAGGGLQPGFTRRRVRPAHAAGDRQLAIPEGCGRNRLSRCGGRPDAVGGRPAAAQGGDAGPDRPELDQGAEPAVQGVGSGP